MNTQTKLKIAFTVFGKKHSKATKEKMAKAHQGRKYSPELIEHNRQAILRPEVRQQKSESRKGEKSHLWRGGITKQNFILRESYEYDIWRTAVFERDNYTCQECGARCGNGKNVVLNADHIKRWSEYPELRFELSNGRTLCVDCHKKTETFGVRVKKSVANRELSFLHLVGSVK